MMPSAEDVRRLGLLGGTFDPIHNGHLALADHAWHRLGLDRVWFIPASIPPHKRRNDMASAAVRWQMTAAAVAPSAPRFVATDIELRRAGPSFTIDTLRQVRAAVGPDVELFWIVGRDNISDIPRWYQPEEIVALATVVVGGRPGTHAPEEVPPWLASRLIVLDGPNVGISSTEVREQARAGRIDPEVVPEPVRRIIARERLYGYPGAVG